MGKGVSPLVATVLMIAIMVSLAGSAFIFITGQQDVVEREVERAQLETINISCTRQTVEWWIRNSAEYGVRDQFADIVFREDGLQNQTLYQPNRPVPGQLSNAESRARLFLTLNPDALKIGQDYTVELDGSHVDVSGTCTAGVSWWDVNWDYRRQIALDSTTVSLSDRTHVEIDPQQMIKDGKLQPHCQDLRVVIGNTAVPHNLSNAPQNCDSTGSMEVTFTVNNVATDQYQTYLYYGNPTADNKSVNIFSGAPQSPLREEERIRLP